jgi:hypothetical protein
MLTPATCSCPPHHHDPPTLPHIQPGEDPFTRLRQEKRQRIKEQSGRQLANAKLAAKAGALPATLRLAANLPEKGKGKHHKRKDLKGEVGGQCCRAVQ